MVRRRPARTGGEFQFHYGTIKSVVCQYADEGYVTFQFHYGTIKSATRNAFVASKANFNSTMVRLKGKD